MNNHPKGRVVGLGKRLRRKIGAGKRRVALWNEVVHEKRSGLRRLLLLTQNKQHHIGGRIKVIDGKKSAAGLQFHELPVEVGKTAIVIRNVNVAPNYRSEQITPAMIKRVIKIAGTLRRVKTVELTVDSDNIRALSIYNKLGFIEYERQTHPEKKNIEILSMALKVNS